MRFRPSLQRLAIFAAVLAVGLGAFITLSKNNARAAGGVFTLDVQAVQPSYLSGETMVYNVNYQCSGATGSDTCDNVVVEVPRPAGVPQNSIPHNGTIAGSAQTTSQQFVGTSGQWTFIPTIPAGSSGTLQVSWIVQNYTTPNDTIAEAIATAYEGTFGGPVVDTDSGATTVNATTDYIIAKYPTVSSPILIGSEYTYTIGLYYNPAAPAMGRLGMDNIVYVDQLPATATYVSSSNSGVYDSGTHTVTWPAFSATSAGQQANPTGTRTVTVRYDAPANQPDDVVTNEVAYTANGLGDPLDSQSGNAQRANTLTDSVTFGQLFQKTPDNTDYASPPANHSWAISLFNRSDVAVSGTVGDVLPCADNESETLYQSPTDPATPCTNPTTHINNIQLQTGSSVSEIRWWASDGTTGTVPGPGTIAVNMALDPQDDLGIASDAWLTAIEFDYGIDANPNPASSSASYRFEARLIGPLDTSLTVGDRVVNTATFTMSDLFGNSADGENTGSFNMEEKIPNLTTQISDTAGFGVVYRPTDIITWEANYRNANVAVDDGKPVRPDWYIAVPEGLRYIPGSVEFTNLPAGLGEPEIIESYPGENNLEGYTILNLRWPDGALLNNNGGLALTRIIIEFQTLVEPTTPVAMYSGTPPNFGAAADADRGIVSTVFAIDEPVHRNGLADIADMDGDGNTSEHTRRSDAPWQIQLAATAFGDVLVQGSQNTEYGYLGQTRIGETSSYQMHLVNASNDGSALRDFVFYATLPYEGDTFVSQNLTGVDRGSDTSVFLTGPVDAPPEVTVLYSLSTNPCRDEVYPNSANPGCVNDWVTADQITDWSLVRSLQFQMDGVYEQGEGEFVEIPVQISDDAEEGDFAWISVAYQATNDDTGLVLLPAEAPRVGLQVLAAVAPPIDPEDPGDPGETPPTLPPTGTDQFTLIITAILSFSVISVGLLMSRKIQR